MLDQAKHNLASISAIYPKQKNWLQMRHSPISKVMRRFASRGRLRLYDTWNFLRYCLAHCKRRICLLLFLGTISCQLLIFSFDAIFSRTLVPLSFEAYAVPVNVTTVRGNQTDTARCWGPADARLTVLSTMLFEKEEVRDVPDCMRANKLEYARLHGYRYCEYSDGLAPEEDLAVRRKSASKWGWSWGKSQQYARYIAVPNMLQHSEYVLYIDADTFFVDKKVSLFDEYIDRYPEKDLILQHEAYFSPLGPFNIGVFIARNTSLVHSLFDRIWTNTSSLNDQMLLNDLMADESEPFSAKTKALALGDLQAIGWRPPILWALFGIDMRITPGRSTFIAHWTCGIGTGKYDAIRRYLGCPCDDCHDSIKDLIGFGNFGGLCKWRIEKTMESLDLFNGSTDFITDL